MHKYRSILIGLSIGTLGFAGFALATKQEKVTICHRTNSVTNPYNKIEVNGNAVDGEGKNDHTHHTGPIATSEQKAQELKDAKTKWGDIIPDKLNWTDEGKQIFENGCEVPTTPPDETPVVTPVPEPTGTGGGNPTAPTELPDTGASY